MIRKLQQVSLDQSDADFKFSKIKDNERLNELEFYFPIQRITAQKLKKIFSPFVNDNFSDSLPEQIGKLDFSPVKGFMKGYIDYKRREYCRDIKCSVQLDLETKEEGSAEYEEIRAKCKAGCIHTTYEFHHWLIKKGYLIVRPEEQK